MWFGAVFADCAVFLGPDGAVFAFLKWQESCSDNFENMKTVNVQGSNPGKGAFRAAARA
jgi:hypothetical protein